MAERALLLIKKNSNLVFLITAKHIIGVNVKSISLFKDNNWQSISCNVYHTTDDSDIAVIQTGIKQDLSDIEANASVTISQQAFFLGFPYFGNQIQYPGEEVNESFPIPMVKSAYISGIQNNLIFLDAHNNPGFSGGPLIICNNNQSKICGIMSGYINHAGEIISKSEEKQSYLENSGIALAYSIKGATDLLEEIPSH